MKSDSNIQSVTAKMYRMRLLRRVFLIVGVGVAVTMASMIMSRYISENYASSSPRFQHMIRLRVPRGGEPMTLNRMIEVSFPGESKEEQGKIAASVRRFDHEELKQGVALQPGTLLLIGYRSKTIVPGWLKIDYTRNYGNAFGLISEFENKRKSLSKGVVSRSTKRLLISISFGVLIAIVSIAIFWGTVHLGGKEGGNHGAFLFADIGLGLFAGGGIANALDRVYTGYVVDYIKLLIVEFPIFNLADIALTVGFFFILVGVWRLDRGEEEEMI